MMSSISSLCPQFNTNRMIREYTERFYLTAHAEYLRLLTDNVALARAHAAWKKHLRGLWPAVRIEMMESKLPPEIQSEESVLFSARVHSGRLAPKDLTVELYSGPLNSSGEILHPVITEMVPVRQEAEDYIYEVQTVPCCGSGRHGYTARVMPRHPDPKHPFAMGLVTWASKPSTETDKASAPR
jgi:glycogen phosphorylase